MAAARTGACPASTESVGAAWHNAIVASNNPNTRDTRRGTRRSLVTSTPYRDGGAPAGAVVTGAFALRGGLAFTPLAVTVSPARRVAG